jgi:hypothetical protein
MAMLSTAIEFVWGETKSIQTKENVKCQNRKTRGQKDCISGDFCIVLNARIQCWVNPQQLSRENFSVIPA